MIKYFCDDCGDEIKGKNDPNGGPKATKVLKMQTQSIIYETNTTQI